MNVSEKAAPKLIEIIAAFIINGVVFGISSFFTDLTFGMAILYTLINAIWMPFLFFPLLPKIERFFERK